MASLVSKRSRNSFSSSWNEYLVYVLHFGIDKDHNRLHEGVKPAVRDAGYGKELKRVQSVAHQKPNDGENDVVNEVKWNDHDQNHGQAVGCRPFGPKPTALQEFRVYVSFSQSFEHAPLLQALQVQPKLRGDAHERRCKNVAICEY